MVMTDIRSTYQWQTLAKTMKKRQPYCSVEGCENTDLQVDHIIALANNGDPWDEQNLQVLCGYHNNKKNSRAEGQTVDYWNPLWTRWQG